MIDDGVVLVTGAAGALGRAVVPALRDEGWTTRALVHTRPTAAADQAIQGDLEDAASLQPAVDGVSAVVHLAAVTHARRLSAYDAVNVGGTRNLLAAAHRAGVRQFVQVSTRAVDPGGGGYSRSKAEAERLVRASGLAFTIVRLPEVYGVGGREGVDGILDRLRSGRVVPVVGGGAQEICPIAIDDAVAALVAALRAVPAANRTYTLAGECMTIRRFTERAAAVVGSRSRIVSVPVGLVVALSALARVLPLPLFPDQLDRLRAPKPAGSPEARDELGFNPAKLEDALRRTVARGPAAAGGSP